MRRIAAAGGLALLLCCIATPALAAPPWTVSLHLGPAKVERSLSGEGADRNTVDERGLGGAVSLGYAPAEWLTVRVLYERASGFVSRAPCEPLPGCAILPFSDVDLDHWQLALLPRYSLSASVSVFATVAVMDWRIRRSGPLPGDSGTALLCGGGVAWQPGRRVEFTLEYQRARLDYQVLRAGVGLRF